MYRQFGNTDYRNGFAELSQGSLTVAKSGQLDALVALERIGTSRAMTRSMPRATARNAGTRSSPGRSGSASFSPMAGATSVNSASAAIVSGSPAATSACIRPKRWTMSS